MILRMVEKFSIFRIDELKMLFKENSVINLISFGENVFIYTFFIIS